MSRVPHPTVPGWLGEAASVMRTDPQFVTWTATDAGAPTAISHARELMREADDWVQDYNYLVYRFGDGADAVVARHYLGDDRRVSVFLPGPPAPFEQACAALPPAVLGWLQQRFATVQVLTNEGYRAVWTDAAD